MNRRRFLHLTAAGAAVTLTTTACAGAAGFELAALSEPALLPAFGGDEVGAVGRRYREMVPAESSVQALRAAILDTRPSALGRALGRDATVAALVDGDFVGGRVVIVNGWVLSATEARQCALYSLIHT